MRMSDWRSDVCSSDLDSLAAILNGVGHGLNIYQGDVAFPTSVTDQQVQDLPDAVGEVTTLDARNADGSARPEITTVDTIVGDINDRVERMTVDDFDGLVEGSPDLGEGNGSAPGQDKGCT